MSKKKEEKKKKRDFAKYPALNQRFNAKTRVDVLDMDYLKKLDDAELQYLNKFMAEYVSGAFKKDENGEYSEDNFHKTAEERKECYTRNNTRNRCALTISNAMGGTYRGLSVNDSTVAFSNHGLPVTLSDIEDSSQDVNRFSDFILDEYEGDYSLVEEDILKQMLRDYNKCISPKTEADTKLAESNYGKMLLLKFKDIKLIKKE